MFDNESHKINCARIKKERIITDMKVIRKDSEKKYRIIGPLEQTHNVFLVRSENDNDLYVMKKLEVYSAEVYNYLKKYPVNNTPRIYEVKETGDGKCLIIEEFIPGPSLSLTIENKRKLSAGKSVEYTIQLCRIVRDLHNCTPPIIHRDIKPDNIIITKEDRLVLLDMNAAKFFNDTSRKDTRLMGTFGYASPEQFGFGKANVQSDIYGIGKVLNVMLTGSVDGEYNGPLASIIKKCCEIDPQNRYQSVDELLIDLGEEVQPENLLYRVLPRMKTVQKKTRIALLLLYGCLTLLLATDEFPSVAEEKLKMFYRFTYTVAAWCIILFNNNCLNIRSRLGINKIRNRYLRIAVIVFADMMILLVLAVIIGSISGVFEEIEVPQ